MKAAILTLGCKVNQAESTFIEGNLIDSGFSIVGLSAHPDYCIINTCSITAKSDYQSRQLIRRALRSGAKRVIVTGCYSQLRSEDIKKIDSRIEIVHNRDKYGIINLLECNLSSYCLGLSGRSRPYVKIQDGCNHSCTYCIVPKARGKSKSTGVSEILDEIWKIESQGYNEIVLTGIHLGSYGRDLIPQVKLSDVLKTVLNKTKIQRIRLSSIEPNEIDRDIIDLLKEERICKHLHVPLQSGDNTILQRMNRTYSSQDYIHIIETVLSTAPEIALGTDVIVGFPGESAGEFKNTKELLTYLPFSYIHIFPFSPRPDTPAARMSNQIPKAVIKERAQELHVLNECKKRDYMISQVDKTLDVIVEQQSAEPALIGTSGNYLKIWLSTKGYSKKSLVHVRTTGIEGDFVKGIPIEKP